MVSKRALCAFIWAVEIPRSHIDSVAQSLCAFFDLSFQLRAIETRKQYLIYCIDDNDLIALIKFYRRNYRGVMIVFRFEYYKAHI